MGEELRELWRYRELLLVMTQRELRVRYKNSALGFFWSFLNPLVTTVVMTFVFGKMLDLGPDKNFGAYVLAAYLPYIFFQFAVLDSAQSVLAALPMIRKVYFPREILPLAAIAGNFVNLLAGYVVFFTYLLFNYARTGFAESPFQLTTWLLPFLMAISFCLATGLGLLVSALNTFYEDVKHVVNVLMYLLLFLCPIMYFYEGIAFKLDHNPLFKIYMLNPQAVLAIAYRKALLPPTDIKVQVGDVVQVAHASPMPWSWLLYATIVSLGALVLGYHVFNRQKWRFVERP